MWLFYIIPCLFISFVIYIITNISENINIHYGVYHIQCPISFFLLFVFFVVVLFFVLGGVYRDIYRNIKEKNTIYCMKRAIFFYSQGLMAFLFQNNNKKALDYIQKGKKQKVDDLLGDIIEFFLQYSKEMYSQSFFSVEIERSCICSIGNNEIQVNDINKERFISFLIKKYPRVKVVREVIITYCMQNKQYDRALYLLKKERLLRVLDKKTCNMFTACIFLEKSKFFLYEKDTKQAFKYAWRSFKLHPCQHNIRMLFDLFIQNKNIKDAELFIFQAYKVIKNKEFILSLYQKILINDSAFIQLKKIKALFKKQDDISDHIRISMAQIALKAGMLGEARFQLEQQKNKKNPITYLLMAKLDKQEGVSHDSYWLDKIESCLYNSSIKFL